ncbi:DNA repair protein RecN [Allomuricauda sp. SCSIO 65647]|uniref:DNA repair protein RecN n=1 Tax=Allomuricauda sp. SCSIO 65647 TaxID=2908843 RepID=UPI001F0210DF|nr:DNA repair protein RecN [Muricauda sp. SCSIO 65647]UJH67598.1 DNA repair protein RecN [Muricauda sp. SCSIO 65647]
MLTNLSIKNYALIDDLNVSFPTGFVTITGETGAGKSILLGALSLVLGKRADLSSLRNKEQKCIVEAEFEIDNYGLQPFFKENDLDYDRQTILRREIHPSGKSRAFINDSPVTLDILSSLGNSLVDVHSQHQTLRLTENEFQLKVVDALANNDNLLDDYRQVLDGYKAAQRDLRSLLDFQSQAIKEHDYNSFLLHELQSTDLREGLQIELEEEYEQLSNVESILETLSQSDQLLNDEQLGILTRLEELKRAVQNISGYGNNFESLYGRIQSVMIELDDLSSEMDILRGGVEVNPQRLQEVNTQLQMLYDLQKKHQAANIQELIAIREALSEKVGKVENLEAQITSAQKAVEDKEAVLHKLAVSLRENRNAVIPKLKNMLQDKLSHLGMPSATFKIVLEASDNFRLNGRDDLIFQFSANKGSDYGELKKVASGGELSRIMLTIKSILAKYERLPTMIFDEIDTGVSGEISNTMANIMEQMSRSMQVFSITHLPQVASKGETQFKVFKEEFDGKTMTRIKKLTEDERVVELAEMLGGKNMSDSALAHAKQLLQVP